MRRPSRPGLLRYCLSVAGPLFVALLCLSFSGWCQRSDPPTSTAPSKRGDTLHFNLVHAHFIDSVSAAPTSRPPRNEDEPSASFVSHRTGLTKHGRNPPGSTPQRTTHTGRSPANAERHNDYSAPKTSH